MFSSVPLSRETAGHCIFYLCTSSKQSSACVQECESCLLISPSHEIILLGNRHSTTEQNETIMEPTRLVLIAFHVLITVFLIHNLHPYLTFSSKLLSHEQHISEIVEFLNRLFAIGLFHSACIVVLWHSHHHGPDMIRATGILLCGELLQIITLVIQNALKTRTISSWRRVYDLIAVWTWLVPLVITFRFAHRIAKRHRDLLRVELLTTSTGDPLMDGHGSFSLV